MNIKLIGTGAIYTAYNSACTLVDNKIIIDMPNGTLKQLLKEKINVGLIDIILITHMHGDHIADIPFFFKHIFNYLKSNKTIKIIGPIGIKKKIMELFAIYNFETEEEFNQLFHVEFIEILENKFTIYNYDITSYLVIHGEEKPSLGYTINNKLGITGDSGLCKGVEKIFENSHVIISDSSLIIGDEFHLGIDNLVYLTKKYNKKVLCTHLRDETREKIVNSQLENINICEDFFEIKI